MNNSENQSTASETAWFLRRRDDEIRGPVSIETLRQWADSAEIIAGQEVSLDCKSWQTVESLPELDMIWFAELKDGSEYGPFNILAASRLVEKGILESDSVIRKREPQADTGDAEPPGEEDPIFQNRIDHLEEELLQLREQLEHIKQDETEPAPIRALTETTSDAVDASGMVDTIPALNLDRLTGASRSPRALQEWRLSTALYAKPERRYEEEPGSFLIEDSEKLHAMARTRRFRAHALRWNAIGSSIILGVGVTLGSLGYMLEITPMQFSGVIIALGGVAYLLVASIALFVSFLVSQIAMHVREPEPVEIGPDHRPLKGALNITFYWFNRTFRSRQ
jgi:hypothetical protein